MLVRRINGIIATLGRTCALNVEGHLKEIAVCICVCAPVILRCIPFKVRSTTNILNVENVIPLSFKNPGHISAILIKRREAISKCNYLAGERSEGIRTVIVNSNNEDFSISYVGEIGCAVIYALVIVGSNLFSGKKLAVFCRADKNEIAVLKLAGNYPGSLGRRLIAGLFGSNVVRIGLAALALTLNEVVLVRGINGIIAEIRSAHALCKNVNTVVIRFVGDVVAAERGVILGIIHTECTVVSVICNHKSLNVCVPLENGSGCYVGSKRTARRGVGHYNVGLNTLQVDVEIEAAFGSLSKYHNRISLACNAVETTAADSTVEVEVTVLVSSCDVVALAILNNRTYGSIGSNVVRILRAATALAAYELVRVVAALAAVSSKLERAEARRSRNVNRTKSGVSTGALSTVYVELIVHGCLKSLKTFVINVNSGSRILELRVNVRAADNHIDVLLCAGISHLVVHIVAAFGFLNVNVDCLSNILGGSHIVAVHCTGDVKNLVFKVGVNHCELVSSTCNGLLRSSYGNSVVERNGLRIALGIGDGCDKLEGKRLANLGDLDGYSSIGLFNYLDFIVIGSPNDRISVIAYDNNGVSVEVSSDLGAVRCAKVCPDVINCRLERFLGVAAVGVSAIIYVAVRIIVTGGVAAGNHNAKAKNESENEK